jgi:hypothetical protein
MEPAPRSAKQTGPDRRSAAPFVIQGGGQAAGEPAIVAEGDFAIDEETEPIGMRYLGRLWIVLQLDEGVGHGGEAEGAQSFDGGVNERWDRTAWRRPRPQ